METGPKSIHYYGILSSIIKLYCAQAYIIHLLIDYLLPQYHSLPQYKNKMYMERWDIHRNVNPHITNIGYTMCRYINWVDEVNTVCNIQYNKHMRMRMNTYMNINMIRFRVGACRINVNNTNMKHIVRSERH